MRKDEKLKLVDLLIKIIINIVYEFIYSLNLRLNCCKMFAFFSNVLNVEIPALLDSETALLTAVSAIIWRRQVAHEIHILRTVFRIFCYCLKN